MYTDKGESGRGDTTYVVFLEVISGSSTPLDEEHVGLLTLGLLGKKKYFTDRRQKKNMVVFCLILSFIKYFPTFMRSSVCH